MKEKNNVICSGQSYGKVIKTVGTLVKILHKRKGPDHTFGYVRDVISHARTR
jgi:hypothetical protein